ncbi:MAG: sigma 54-interacting transcriptional regulator [Peptococcaceae bacterium]|nr:sigma 54-interacting transcriptional regulator [Peptococcaceae bacterium]
MRMQQVLGHKIIAHSNTFMRTIDLATRVAQTDSTVLILGESGVGKEVIAHLIYQLNKRREKGAFIKINCGAIPEDLLESELFGYDTGAFTGAKKEGKKGMFELAQQGVIFLDEIAELPLRLQVKLLRVLQEKEFFRLGAVKPVNADVQIIAATNKDLLEAVKAKSFREDLYYRLNVVPIVVPPLRERWEDIVPLILLYLNEFNEKYKQSKFFSSECLKVMLSYSWPGNVRQLANLIERLVVTCEEQMIRVQDLPGEIKTPVSISDRFHINESLSLPEALSRLEREMVEWTMRRYRSTYKAAKALGVSQSTVARCVKKYGLFKGNTG